MPERIVLIGIKAAGKNFRQIITVVEIKREAKVIPMEFENLKIL